MADKAVSKLTQVVNHAVIGNCFMVAQKGAGAGSTNRASVSALQIPYASVVNAYAGGSNAFGVKTVSSDRITPAFQTINDVWYDVYPRSWTVTDSTVHVINQSTNAFIKAASMYVKQAGAWTQVKEAWIKDAGTWKQILSYVPVVTVSVSTTVIGGGGGGGAGGSRGFRAITCHGGQGGGNAGAAAGTITVTKNTSYAVQVGGGGGAGASSGVYGGGGGTSSFGSSLIYATGGGGGCGYYVQNCAGGGNGSWGGSAPGIYGSSLISPYGGAGAAGYCTATSSPRTWYPATGGQSGVVVIKVPSTTSAATTTGTVSVTTVGSETVYTFTSSGTITFA
jgi:hypothetical protein